MSAVTFQPHKQVSFQAGLRLLAASIQPEGGIGPVHVEVASAVHCLTAEFNPSKDSYHMEQLMVKGVKESFYMPALLGSVIEYLPNDAGSRITVVFILGPMSLSQVETAHREMWKETLRPKRTSFYRVTVG